MKPLLSKKLASLLSVGFLYLAASSCGTISKEAASGQKTEQSALAFRHSTEKKSRAASDLERPKDDTQPIKHNTEEYDLIEDNAFKMAKTNPLSTFSIDVDGAAYSNCRRMIMSGSKPNKDAVRIEEFINYFDYGYPNPKGELPFEVVTEVANAPWNPQHKLVQIALQGKKLDYENLAPSNLVFLLDVSGSMEDENKLPLLRSSLKMLLEELKPTDRVAIVVYAGAAGMVLPSTPVSEKKKIIDALDNLQAGGSTAGGEGILLAYKVAKDNFIKNGNNRIILATDGDFNVGTSSTSDLVRLVQEKRKEGVYLTICGLGMGNYKDGRMEQISNAGNGNYYYIDNIKEARKVFVKEMRATLFTIAKDVKLQVEFNPAKVQGYRLIGYENRVMANEDFADDTKDAGELGAGHTVTALYEIIPVGVESPFLSKEEALKYQQTGTVTNAAGSNELFTVKLRYKKPSEDLSVLLEKVVEDKNTDWKSASEQMRFASAVAAFGMVLRESPFKGNSSYDLILEMANSAKGKDEEGYRAEFIEMVQACKVM